MVISVSGISALRGMLPILKRTSTAIPQRARRRPAEIIKSIHDRQDRTSAFAASADLSLDLDDAAVHRPSSDRHGTLFRHAIARMVANRSRLRPRRLFQCAGLYRQHHRPADPVRLYLGAPAPSLERHPASGLGPRLWLQGQ